MIFEIKMIIRQVRNNIHPDYYLLLFQLVELDIFIIYNYNKWLLIIVQKIRNNIYIYIYIHIVTTK